MTTHQVQFVLKLIGFEKSNYSPKHNLSLAGGKLDC